MKNIFRFTITLENIALTHPLSLRFRPEHQPPSPGVPGALRVEASRNVSGTFKPIGDFRIDYRNLTKGRIRGSSGPRAFVTNRSGNPAVGGSYGWGTRETVPGEQ